MPTAASLNFTPLTDSLVWFPDYQSFNAWFGAITVTLDGTNIPVATVTDYGAVKMAAAVTNTYTPPSYGGTYYSNLYTDVDGSGTLVLNQLATKACVDQLITNVAELRAIVVDLLAKLAAAGVTQ